MGQRAQGVLLQQSAGGRRTLITSLAATRNRWCRMRACILNPGLWNVSAGHPTGSTMTARSVLWQTKAQGVHGAAHGSHMLSTVQRTQPQPVPSSAAGHSDPCS